MAKTWEGPSPYRLGLAREVEARRAEGMTTREIAEWLGVSRGYVRDLHYDPDGYKSFLRKQSYQGVCVDCGAPTDGGNGRANAPERCNICAPIRRTDSRKWSREKVIAAIQLWAAEHDGKAPTAAEWQAASTDERFPPSSTVYSKRRSGGQPFAKWADAIEAAGFRRPLVGCRVTDRQWTPEAIIEAIQAASEDGLAPPIDFDHSVYSTARHYFGSWKEACRIAGVRPRREPAANGQFLWTRENVIADIRALAIDDMPPSASEYHSLHRASWMLFGSWGNAVRAAGYEPLGSGNSARAKRRKALVKELQNG